MLSAFKVEGEKVTYPSFSGNAALPKQQIQGSVFIRTGLCEKSLFPQLAKPNYTKGRSLRHILRSSVRRFIAIPLILFLKKNNKNIFLIIRLYWLH